MRIFFLLTLLALTGCQTIKHSLETGASTTALCNSPVIEKINFDIKHRMEW